MPETCENWLGLLNSCVYYAHQIRKILPGIVLLNGIQNSRRALKSTE